MSLLAVPHVASAGQTEQTGQPAIGSRQDAELILILTRSTLIGLHRANVSGNYSTMRDLSAPRMKERFTTADLSLAFTALRRHRINLEAAAILQPVFSPAPYIDGLGALRIGGWLGTTPENITFDLTFEAVNGSWLLLDIGVRPIGGQPEDVIANRPPPPDNAMPGLLDELRRGADDP